MTTNTSSKVIDLTPATNSGVAVRIFADSPFQFSKWRLALQSSAADSIARYYQLDSKAFIGVGVHGIVRRAYPQVCMREASIASSTTASEYSTHQADIMTNQSSRGIFKRRVLSGTTLPTVGSYNTRNSVELDPDAGGGSHGESVDAMDNVAVAFSKTDKRVFRQMSDRNSLEEQSTLVESPNQAVSVAVKTISRTGNGVVTVASEILYAKCRVNHFALIKVLDMFETVNEVHIVMEECMGGSLTQFVQTNGPFSEEEGKGVFGAILKGVGYLHACGIVHWDICPNNILFLNSARPFEPKLMDFGTARPIDPENGRVPGEFSVFSEQGKVASLACASPELLTSKAHRYAAKADMWQLGCVLYFLLTGKLPFQKGMRMRMEDMSVSSRILAFCKKRSVDRREVLFGTGDGHEGGMERMGISDGAKELIMKLLCPNPRMRPNALQCLKEFGFLSDSKS